MKKSSYFQDPKWDGSGYDKECRSNRISQETDNEECCLLKGSNEIRSFEQLIWRPSIDIRCNQHFDFISAETTL